MWRVACQRALAFISFAPLFASLLVYRLKQLPEGTFGRAYADFMGVNQFEPDGRSSVRFVDDAELAYVMGRYRQVHDFWHVLAGLPPTVLGELAIKWLELAVTGLPVCALSALVGPAALPSESEQTLLRRVYLPWALRCGRQCQPLMSVWYEKEWETSLEDLRRKLQFEPAPQLPS